MKIATVDAQEFVRLTNEQESLTREINVFKSLIGSGKNVYLCTESGHKSHGNCDYDHYQYQTAPIEPTKATIGVFIAEKEKRLKAIKREMADLQCP